MGSSFYSYDDRTTRAVNVGYHTKSREQIFIQSVERKAHKDMMSQDIAFREARDSEAHPNSTPIILALDVTGSMGQIPHELIKDGLPTMMSSLIQNGVPDAALMFCAVGDHECDHYPLQVAQFESGDEELDMWLTRTYLEGGGGGNAGESYPLAWYFAAFHTQTDAWDKRKQKGFLFTIGDEPYLKNFPMSSVKSIMGKTAVGQKTYTAEELLAAAQERYNVFHIFVEHRNYKVTQDWKNLLGQNLIILNDHTEVAKTIANTIVANLPVDHSVTTNKVSVATAPAML